MPRRATGMTADTVAAALDARFVARQDSRHEHLADDTRDRAELAERERLAQLLEAASPGTAHDPSTDDAAQAELAADIVAATVWEAELGKGADRGPARMSS